MINSPKVVVKIKPYFSLNNIDRKAIEKNKFNKSISGMFDYYGNEKKRVINMFDYYDGTLTKDNHINIMLENGTYATKEDIVKRKKQYTKYIENSNIWKCIISFNNDYLTTHIHYEKLEKALVKEILPMFYKKIGFKDIKNMSYQIALHSDTDNLHYHFSFVEKKPNYVYLNKIGYRRQLKIEENDINFLKNQIVHYIEKETIYKPLLKETNKSIDELKKYFKEDEKCFILKDKESLILESKIYELGELLFNNQKGLNNKIKYNSIKDKEIKQLTIDIKKSILNDTSSEFHNDYNCFKKNLKQLNKYFKNISKDNNINDFINNDLVKSKDKYLNNYILNSIVNYANKKYRMKDKLIENKIIKDIILNMFKSNIICNNKTTLNNYFSGNHKFANKYQIEQAIKIINNEMEHIQNEFSKMFNYVEKN